MPGFLAAQLAGLVIGTALLIALYPNVGHAADNVVVGHDLPPTGERPVSVP